MAVKKTVLPDGLRIITERITSIRSVAIGVWVNVGSRNERASETGISHLIEHMFFKGTKARNAKEIANSIEQLGGAINAFTTREQTCFYIRALDEHLPQAVDVLSDMLMNSTFTPHNLRREKLVVLEEIKETIDSPAELVHDIFAEKFWVDHPLGRSILGDPDSVRSMPRKRIIDYVKANYTSGNVVISAAGNLSHDELVNLVKKRFKFSRLESPVAEAAVAPSASAVHFVEKDIAQNHFVLGLPSIDFSDKRKFAALGLNFYLGGGMSSALFQEIREKRGLAYTVYTFQDFYRDSGVFGVYLSTDGKGLPKSLDVILKQFRLLKKRPLTVATLEKIKAQIKGSLIFSMESASGRMNRLARHELMLGKSTSLSKSLSYVDAMTPRDLQEAAQHIFDEKRLVAVSLGPVSKSDLGDALAV